MLSSTVRLSIDLPVTVLDLFNCNFVSRTSIMLLLSIKAIYLNLLPRSLLSVSISLDLITTMLINNLLVTCMDARIEYVVFSQSGRT
jgi:hypothetical protein